MDIETPTTNEIKIEEQVIIEEPIRKMAVENKVTTLSSFESNRQLASVQRVISLSPISFTNKETGIIEVATNVELAKVLGWEVIVKKGELKENDISIYFEIDGIVPFRDWSEFLKDKNRPEKPIRLKSKRMLNVLSQGLLLPISVFPELKDIEIKEGLDVTNILNITKWEPEIAACLKGKARGNRCGWVSKTDEDRIQSNLRYLSIFQGKEVYISQKMDGSSWSATYFKKEFHVCSRNLDMVRDENNAFWKIALKYNIEEKLKDHYEKTGEELVLQGELCGPSIQKNRIGLKDLELYIFNVINICGNKDFDLNSMVDFCNTNGLKHVPILKKGIFDYKNVDELLNETKNTYPNGHINEGIVIRPLIPEIDVKTGSRLSFKVISNEFLLLTKD